jgi:hypothetical protein
MMNNKEFKKVFNKLAQHHGFTSVFGGWYKESSECIVILELQKSNFGNYYQLLIKTFIQGAFSMSYTPNKELIKSSCGHITKNENPEYKNSLDLDISMDDNSRIEQLENLFQRQIMPFMDKALSKIGITELAQNSEIYLLPAVKKELGVCL